MRLRTPPQRGIITFHIGAKIKNKNILCHGKKYYLYRKKTKKKKKKLLFFFSQIMNQGGQKCVILFGTHLSYICADMTTYFQAILCFPSLGVKQRGRGGSRNCFGAYNVFLIGADPSNACRLRWNRIQQVLRLKGILLIIT